MALFDQPDFVSRLRAVLPRGWFSADAPVLSGLLAAFAWSHAQTAEWISYIRAQTRLATATGELLDIYAQDYLGYTLPRLHAEADAAYRIRIRAAISRPRTTRQSLYDTLLKLTGQPPLIVEPARSTDTGGYGVACGYGAGGAYGSLSTPFQCFVTAYRPHVGGIPGVDGWGGSIGGYGVGALEYASSSFVTGVTDDAIRAAVLDVLPIAVTCWLRITNVAPVAGSQLDVNFYLDASQLADGADFLPLLDESFTTDESVMS